MSPRRARRAGRILQVSARWLIYALATLLVLTGVLLLALETQWAKNQLRQLLVREANQYLAATLEIDRLEGSLVRGLTLGGVRLSRDGQTLIAIEAVSLSYSIRELVGPGTTIRRLRLVNPRILAAREQDGRWNLSSLVRREARQQERTGPGRPIRIDALEIVNGSVSVADPLSFGIIRVPQRYDALNVDLSFAYQPVQWELTFRSASWSGGADDLSVRRLSGTIGSGPAGWLFDRLSVETPKSAFAFTGGVDRQQTPSILDLTVNAERFSFQEWAVVVPQLRNIAVEASFDTRLTGPLTALTTDINLNSTGGSVRGRVVLNTRVPGWRGAGAVDVNRLNMASWLNRADRPSDISGHVEFDLALGPRFPRGSYTFAGTHAAYLGYEADDVQARGTITETEVLIADMSATAYGANMRVADGAIGIDQPYPYRFTGVARGVDLRMIPDTVPVPHVESTLALSYDVRGRFTSPFIVGGATFEPSTFLGASIGAGTVGAIDTSAPHVRYSGEGDIAGIDLNRFGTDLDVAWLQEPRYAGTVSGRFRVAGEGAAAATMTLDGGGRLARGDLFGGTLQDAEVSIGIAGGSLSGSYDGRFTTINPALAISDPRLTASLTGFGSARVTVRDLLVRTPTLADYSVESSVTLEQSSIRNVPLERASGTSHLRDGVLTIAALEVDDPGLAATGAGTIGFDEQTPTRFEYDIALLDLARLAKLPETGSAISADTAGRLTTRGRLTGTWARLQLTGAATISGLESAAARALSTSGDYDISFPAADPAQLTARVNGRTTFVELFDQTLQQVEGVVTYQDNRLVFSLNVDARPGLAGALAGALLVDRTARRVGVAELSLAVRNHRWVLVPSAVPPSIAWDDTALSVTPIAFSDEATGKQRIDVSGDWREDGRGALRLAVTGVYLDTIAGGEAPARYGGVLDAVAIVTGTRAEPRVTSTITVNQGRVRRLSYERLAGIVNYARETFEIDLRLDQSAGIWLSAVGTVPLALFDANRPEQPLNVAIRSSAVNLGLIEGVTDVVRDVEGEVLLDITAVGTSHDPHFTGSVDIKNAAFTTVPSGARYRNGVVALRVARDRVAVETLHLEDRDGHPLDVRGTLGTHELTVGDLAIEVSAREFEVLRNLYGTVEVDAKLTIIGTAEAPRFAGVVTIVSGNVDVDAILDRTLFQPYSTEAASAPGPAVEVDAIAALNPWERLGLDIELHVPNTLRMSGDDVQVTAGTPIGLGDIDLRVLGDLYLYKDPGQPLYVTGSFDQVTGAYAFQGRRFDLDPISSINFRGDLNPELYITVKREISGVETRVTIAGPLREPELRLASTPPLDSTDILSLIVFNAPANLLSGQQQRELAVRAGTIAAGFLATPLVSALERTLGLDILEIEASTDPGSVARVTIGDEIAPGVVARFTRQFGEQEYDEATIEVRLSNIFRIRATFSDASTSLRRSPFRRVERAGIDLLIFFSF